MITQRSMIGSQKPDKQLRRTNAPKLANIEQTIFSLSRAGNAPSEQMDGLLRRNSGHLKKSSGPHRASHLGGVVINYVHQPPRRSSVANAGGRPFCQELGMGWVHIGQWIFSISAISHELFWRNCVFCVFTL